MAAPGFASEMVAALQAHGFAAAAVAAPSGRADATILTEGLSSLSAAERHWNALAAAKAARRSNGFIVLLQLGDTYSGLEGLSRTLRKEWPEVKTFAWTLTARIAADAAKAVANGFGDGVITSGGVMSMPEPGAPLAPPKQYPAAEPGLWLVTGGARGVTAACAIELARMAGGTVLLAGRSAEMPWPDDLPPVHDIKTLRGRLVDRSRKSGQRITPAEIDRTARGLLAGAEIRETLAAIREAGAASEYVPLDAGDGLAVASTLAAIQNRLGPITGWVHGAGVLADKLAMDKTEAELRRVFAPKVDGLINVLAAIDPGQLRHIGFFSSAAAFFGNKGQSDYAMANALLASAGRSLSQAFPAARVKVFHWGPWAGGMVDGALASHFEAQGIPLIPVDEGARIFASELLGGARDQVELVVGEAWATA